MISGHTLRKRLVGAGQAFIGGILFLLLLRGTYLIVGVGISDRRWSIPMLIIIPLVIATIFFFVPASDD